MLKYIWAERSRVYHDRDFAKERCNTDDIKSRKESDSLAEAQGQSVRVTPYPKRRFCLVCRKAKGVARDA